MLQAGNKVILSDSVTELTISSIIHYAKDIYLVSFLEEDIGYHSFTIKQLMEMRDAYLSKS